MSALPSVEESAGAARAGLLYERHAAKILRFCRARLSPQDAEDAVQHTFLNAYRSLSAGTVPRSEAAWLFAIAENVCRERRRSAWRRSRIEVVSDDGCVDAPAPERPHDELEGLADAISALTPNQRRAILMREWQGLSYREIAAELEVSEAAVETLLFRARRSLARKLEHVRGRARSWGDLGSALASGKTLLGGAAAKVAAATLVVAAGVTVATLRTHEPNARRAAAAAPARHRPAAAAPQTRPARATTGARVRPSRPTTAPRRPRRTALERSARTRTAPAAPVATQPPVAAAPAPPAAGTPPSVKVPPVEVPPVVLPQVPPPPALPPLPPPPPVPTLPSGGVPPLPPVPPLP